MRKMLLSLGLILGVVGCGGLEGIRNTQTADTTAVHFIELLQKRHWDGAYEYFSDRLKDRVSYEQFSELFNMIDAKDGELTEFEPVVKLFRARTENYPFPDIPDEDIHRYTYELKYGAETIDLFLTVIKEDDGVQYIGWFGLANDGIESKPEVKAKYELLDI